MKSGGMIPGIHEQLAGRIFRTQELRNHIHLTRANLDLDFGILLDIFEPIRFGAPA